MQKFTVGEGKYQIVLELEEAGNGLLAYLHGGSLSHIGGIALANPCLSLTGDGHGCDVWSLHLPGHRDHIVAEVVAKRLCAGFQIPISLTAGIHIDNATQQEIEILTQNCNLVASEALCMEVHSNLQD